MPKIIAKTLSIPNFLSQRFILILMATFILFLLVFYFFQIQALTKNSYLLSQNQSDFLKSQTQNLVFSQQSVDRAGLKTIEEQALALNFVKNDNIKYLPLSNDYLTRLSR